MRAFASLLAHLLLTAALVGRDTVADTTTQGTTHFAAQSRVSDDAVWTVHDPPASVTTACDCAHWIGSATGHWTTTTDTHTSTASTSPPPHPRSSTAAPAPLAPARAPARCSLVGPSFDEILAPLRKSTTVYLLGNSVTRGLVFTLRAMLNPGTKVLSRLEAIDACGAVRDRDHPTHPRPPGFGGRAWPNFHCAGDGGGLKVRFGFSMWFDNTDGNGTRDGMGHNATKHMANFFWNHTTDDVLFVMLGHNYPHGQKPSPPDSHRETLMHALRTNFRGLVVFATATPFRHNVGKQNHKWLPQLEAINHASRKFFRRNRIPVIDTWRFCTAEMEHSYADWIHLGSRPDGDPGQLAVTILRSFATVVRDSRRDGSKQWCSAGQ
eukprot:m.160671 g.160671  ORF g.160671 m.160671 type:complete len:380 (-) comp23804_c0_seq1:484-1623(-)